MKIFISGGTGFVGGHVCRELLARGDHLRLMVHVDEPVHRPGIEFFAGSVLSPESCIRGVEGCDAVINLVGIIREFPCRNVTFSRLHVDATRNMLAAAKENGISRYLHMSALGARPGAVSGYHRSKYEAEKLVCSSALAYTIFRPSLIYGPHDAFVNMIASSVRKYLLAPVIGDGAYRLQPVSADDVARCFALALEKPETECKAYNLCGPDRLTYLEVVNTVARVLGKNCVLKIKTPLLIMQLVTALMERFPFYPVTSDQITMLLEESICDSSWPDCFGFEPVGFEEGISGYLG